MFLNIYYTYKNFRFSISPIIKNSQLCRYPGNFEPTLILRPPLYLALKSIITCKVTNLNALVKLGCHLPKMCFYLP